MLTMLGKSMLFFASYSPLLAILALRQYEATVAAYGQGAGILILMIGPLAAVATALLAPAIFKEYDNIRGQRRKLGGRIDPVEKDALLYFVTYVIPFVGISKAEWTDLASYLIVFVVIYSLYVRAGLIYLNPVLSMIGFKTYKIAMSDRNIVLITRKAYRGSVNAEMIEMTDGVYYEPKH